jgi:glucose/arabinose dehydrogenase
LCALAAIAVVVIAPGVARAGVITLPPGFNDNEFARGLAAPTAMAFAPDGRLFVLEKEGTVRVVEDGAVLPTPALTLSVDPYRERGLLGIAFDPNFPSNPYVYLYYTNPVPACHNQVSRFVVNGDLIDPLSEDQLIDIGVCGSGGHNAGAVHFGLDGKLYIDVGENNTAANSQDMTNLKGKMLRINPDGTIPTSNPFYGTTTGSNKAIYAIGLRNPFTFAVQPGTGRIFIDDVGNATWEEINDVVPGGNYGWPDTEGKTDDPRYISPLYTYMHSYSTAPFACAITGGTFYNPSTVQFPGSYLGKYFFQDFCGGWVHMLDPATGTAVDFASGYVSPVDIQTGPDGGLYVLTHEGGPAGSFVHEITASNLPGISKQPRETVVGPGEKFLFNVTASGDGPITYQWQKNGVNVNSATMAGYSRKATAADDGTQWRVVVSNLNGSVTSKTVTLHVDPNSPPVATITTPVRNAVRYKAGDTISFAGTGSDFEDGDLPASAFNWSVVFHHATHTHPFIDSIPGVKSGTFVIPNTGETAANVWYRIHLTVTDSHGATATAYVDVRPIKARLTFKTVPTGLNVRLEDVPAPAPFTIDSVVGMLRDFDVDSPQTINGQTWVFDNWSDDGAKEHTVPTPSGNKTYTAVFALANNLLVNGNFERDANHDGLPDGWTTNSHAKRSKSTIQNGVFAMQHSSTNESNYTISQDVAVTGGSTYSFSGWINVPATGDAFSFVLEARWLNSGGGTISTTPIATYSAGTGGWVQATKSLVAPGGAAKVSIRQVVTGLSATVVADNFVLK